MKEPTFKINPKFKLTTKHLSVVWTCVDRFTLECEAAIMMPDRFVYQDKIGTELMAQYHNRVLDMIYHDATDFEARKIQKWLRELMRDVILRVAKGVQPARVKYWENLKNLHGTGGTVKRLRKNVLGYSTFHNRITLQPFLVIFKQEWMDCVILHEMAHYKYKYHRKSFWNFLSTLIGEDSLLPLSHEK
ncbi:MAG: DUF45 domain-containing protein [Muribaculaceae bacterium]|nr:DUF45 domain-containing protein [Muribaculaceae bacterium]